MSDTPIDAGPGFVANYPPFSRWSEQAVPQVMAALDAPHVPGTPLGLYVHVPFCRKRCRFCYFKVYTERPSAEIRAYVDALGTEAARYAERAFVGDRALSYVYVGGGTPSYLSGDQIRQMFDEIRAPFRWRDQVEVTFECEPGTVRAPKMQTLADLGVTRVSLGVENWDAHVLEVNGRAHTDQHIEPAYAMCRDAGIPQINIDLIAGMIGESDDNWAVNIARTIALQPDSVTIYQLEIPANTALYRALKGEEDVGGTVADATTRRRWAREAFEQLQAAGYTMTSGYTAVRGDPDGRFVYRDALWRGADMIPLGVSAFGQIHGVHLQNDKHLPRYLERIGAGELPIQRAYAMSDAERLVREFVLQLKLGTVSPAAFQTKFDVDVLSFFAAPLAALQAEGLGTVSPEAITLSWHGLLQVDRVLPWFFLPQDGGMVGRSERAS